jgi:hypothetical protein
MSETIEVTAEAELTARDLWLAKIGELGRDFGKGQATAAQFMYQLAIGARDMLADAAENADSKKDDLHIAIETFNRRATRANDRAKTLKATKARMSELRGIMGAARLPQIDFPAVLDRVSADWDAKAKTTPKPIARRQMDQCFIRASVEQRKLAPTVGATLTAEQIDEITRKPAPKAKALCDLVAKFHKAATKMVDDNPLSDAEQIEQFAALIDACEPFMVVEQTAEEKAAIATQAAADANERATYLAERLAALEAQLNARMLPTVAMDAAGQPMQIAA